MLFNQLQLEDQNFLIIEQSYYNQNISFLLGLKDYCTENSDISDKSYTNYSKDTIRDVGFKLEKYPKDYINKITHYFELKYKFEIKVEKIIYNKKVPEDLEYIHILEEITLQVGNANFNDLINSEIKTLLTSEWKTYRDDGYNKVFTNKNKLIINDWLGYEDRGMYGNEFSITYYFADKGFNIFEKALSLFIYNDIRNIEEFSKWKDKIRGCVDKDKFFTTHYFNDIECLKSIKFYKNKKVEIEFSNTSMMQEFINKFLGFSVALKNKKISSK